MTELPLAPGTLARGDAYAYACHGCGRCCYGKSIRVSPYEAARLADVLGTSTTAVLARDVDPATGALRRTDTGACTYFRGGGCSVHAGRPLACRLYPLGWLVAPSGEEVFVRYEGHPESEGVTGTDGTVQGYLDGQGTTPYQQSARRYEVVLRRLRIALEADGPDPGEPPPVADVDAAVGADCAARGVPVPEGVEARVDLHLALLHRWLDGAGAPPAEAPNARARP